MYDRIEVKARGKAAFKNNYWPCVLAALILALFVNNSLGVPGGNVTYQHYTDGGEQQPTLPFSEFFDPGSAQTIAFVDDAALPEVTSPQPDAPDAAAPEALGFAPDFSAGRGILDTFFNFGSLLQFLPFIGILALILSIGAAVVFFALALKIFVFNILEIGGCRFFLDNAGGQANLSGLMHGFSSGYYGNLAKIQFFRMLKTFLWSLLFVIPGIVKSLEYAAIPYLLAEDPGMTQEEAFARSRELMDGHKLDYFVLGLSFIGWFLLGVLTFGILNIFWTNPYQYASQAEFFRVLTKPVEEPYQGYSSYSGSSGYSGGSAW